MRPAVALAAAALLAAGPPGASDAPGAIGVRGTTNGDAAGMASSPEPPRAGHRAPGRYALLIAISDYREFDLDGPPGRSDLLGPANDVERVRLSLRRFGFDGENVRVLTDGAASLAGIEEGFRWLAERATGEDDAVVVFYSGHGTSVPDADGDEAAISPGDTRDEALVPWDAADIHDAAQLVTDDLIREWVAAIGTGNVTLLVDACYSGTITRGEAVAPHARPRGAVGAPSGGAMDPLGGPEHTLLTAASADQVAQELPLGDDNRWYGLLTFYLTAALDGAGEATRYEDLVRRVRGDVRGKWTGQTPQLEGDGGALLFRVGEGVARRPFVMVSPSGDGRWAIDAGAVHGVRKNALYEVHGPGELAFRGRPLGWVRVDSVAERAAYGAAVSPAASPEGPAAGFPEEARAILSRVPLGASTLERLAVHVSPPDGAAARALDSLDFVARTAEESSADAVVREEGGAARVAVKGFDLPPLATDLVREGEGPGGPFTGFVASGEALCRPLARAYAIAAFDRIRNPEPPPRLEADLRVTPEGAGPPPPGTTGEAAVDTLRIDRRYDIWARVGAAGAGRLEGAILYLTAAVEGYVGTPFVLHPTNAAEMNRPFPLEQWVRLAGGVGVSEPAGPEVLKAVVGSDQYDFHSLVGRVEGLCGPTAVRGLTGDAEAEVSGWTTAERRLFILPPEGG